VFGTADSEIAWGVASDAGGLTVTGYTYGSLDGKNQGSFDVFVRRYSRTGSLVWRRQFGTNGADLGIDVAADSKGFTVVGHGNGSLGGSPKGELDVFVRRFLRDRGLPRQPGRGARSRAHDPGGTLPGGVVCAAISPDHDGDRHRHRRGRGQGPGRVILGRFVTLAGGRDARIAVISTASSLGPRPPSVGAIFTELGASGGDACTP